MILFDIQLFANTSTKGGSSSSSSTQSQGGSTSHSEGGSSSEGGSHSHTESNTHTEGQSHSHSYGKSWWSGEVEENTREHRDAYNTDYEEGQKVTDAYNRLQETIDNKPTFESKYEDKLNELYESIMGRDKFKYDFNADPMYQMYKDKYVSQGKQAMEDTMGKAQAMNGGYGSSVAQSVGQQAYQNYLNEVNDMIPTLRDQAFQQYQYEGQEMLNKYNVTANAYDREYGHYRDDVADWQADRSFNYGMYSDERNFDYSQFVNERGFWNDEYWKERQSETSNEQFTDTYYSEDSHTSSDTDTSFWENSHNWNNTNTSNWSKSNTQANTSHWSSSASAGSGSGSGAAAKVDAAANNNAFGATNAGSTGASAQTGWTDWMHQAPQTNSYAPFNISEDSYIAQHPDQMQNIADFLKSQKSGTDLAKAKKDLEEELGLSSAEIALALEVAKGNRNWY